MLQNIVPGLDQDTCLVVVGDGPCPCLPCPAVTAIPPVTPPIVSDDSPFVVPAVTTIPAVTTAPMVTTVMNPPMMAATILPVIFAAAVIKALILGRYHKIYTKM